MSSRISSDLSDRDRFYLDHAIDVSRRALEHEGRTPFGAIIVIADQILGEGTSSVVELQDPTAHAEVMALRQARTSDATSYPTE
jgi:guanine deaminase